MYIFTNSGLAEAPPNVPANCSSISKDRFDKQPPELQRVLTQSFSDPAAWFERLDPEKRIALADVFNRLCRYGVWNHVRLVLKIGAGEEPVLIADNVFNVPGRTPSVKFMSRAGDQFMQALMATGKFCMAHGIGASQHPGQTTLREISSSDSMHVSIGPGDQFDVHIDKFSPVTEHPHSSFCSNAPSGAAVTHIGREVVPGWVRKRFRIGGFQVLPERSRSSPSEPPPRQEGDSPSIIGVTLRGPKKRPAPRVAREASALLSAEVRTQIDQAIAEQVNPEALVPSSVRVRRDKARWAAETAGPTEEAALRKARDAAERAVDEYPEVVEFALELAERMEQARRKHIAWIKINLPQFGNDFSSRRPIAEQIRRIALIVRNYLPDAAKNVRDIVIFFGLGNLATREQVQLPWIGGQ